MRKFLKSRRSKGVIAAACGVALLFTGSTFALWSASGNANGGKIIAGNLDLRVGEFDAWDVSQPGPTEGYRGDQTTDLYDEYADCNYDGAKWGHPITPATWRAVPQDEWLFVLPIMVALEGDNLVAELTVDVAKPLIYANGVDWEYTIFAGGNTNVQTWTTLADGTYRGTTLLQAHGAGQAAGQDDRFLPPLANDPIPTILQKALDGPNAPTGGPVANACLLVKGTFLDQSLRNLHEEELMGMEDIQLFDDDGDPILLDPDDPDSFAFGNAVTVSLKQIRERTDLFGP
ncbi:MAG: SipW-dependent-type signal peptide-containing protein [Micrococcales bacterium]|nr:SipW-dependent-type signal peptide-containing protein [Micrococcales bacterium]